MQLYLNVLAEA